MHGVVLLFLIDHIEHIFSADWYYQTYANKERRDKTNQNAFMCVETKCWTVKTLLHGPCVGFEKGPCCKAHEKIMSFTKHGWESFCVEHGIGLTTLFHCPFHSLPLLPHFWLLLSQYRATNVLHSSFMKFPEHSSPTLERTSVAGAGLSSKIGTLRLWMAELGKIDTARKWLETGVSLSTWASMKMG